MRSLSHALLAIALLASATLHAAEKPNILLVLVDDMGYSDLGCFGSEIDTPNIDALAAGGITFTDFTNCSKCETTRTTLMTGRYHTEVKGKSRNSITIPENLGLAGYHNIMVGKWHIFDEPLQRGFDRYFGFLEGATNFFTGEGTYGKFSYRLENEPYEIPEDFYCTDDFTDHAIRYIDERDREKPFFLYLAYNAPHYPLHAHKDDVMKYRGRYKDGWEALRQKRYAKMKKLGIIPDDMPLSEPAPDVRAWDSLSADEQDDMDLRMAAYAAMIDRVDQQLGRVIQRLESENIRDNTLIIFLSDNGACPFDRTREPTLEDNLMPWDGASYYCYPKEWANACNTPLRLYKQTQNEGGISTPMIANWPDGIANPGRIDRQRAHLIDFHATFRELAGVDYPETYGEHQIGPARGISLAPTFRGETRPEHPYLYQNFSNKYTALVKGEWKLVDYKHLYNIKKDRTEINDLAEQEAEKFAEMQAAFLKLDEELNGGEFLKKQKRAKNNKQ